MKKIKSCVDERFQFTTKSFNSSIMRFNNEVSYMTPEY